VPQTPVFMNPNIARQRVARLVREAARDAADPGGALDRQMHEEALRKTAEGFSKLVLGETPGEMAFNLALGLPGKALKSLGLGAAAAAYSPDSEAGLIASATKATQGARKILADLVGGEGKKGDVGRVMADLQEQNLPIEALRKAEQIRAQSPAYAEASPYMLPRQLQKSVHSPGKTIQMYDERWQMLPPDRELLAAALAGEPKRGWYQGARNVNAALYGPDATKFANLQAALSPQTSVESNLQNALRMWRSWNDAGRPLDTNSINRLLGENVQSAPLLTATGKGERPKAGVEALARSVGVPEAFMRSAKPEELRILLTMYGERGPRAQSILQQYSVLDAWRNNAARALRGERGLSGPKVDNFARSLDPHNPFASLHGTNDTWDANLMGLKQTQYSGALDDTARIFDPGYSPSYTMSSAKKARVADELGWTPGEVQETTWSYAKPVGEAGPRGPLRPPESVINAVPDFQTLMRNPEYRRFLTPKQQRALDNIPVQATEVPTRRFTPEDDALLENVRKRIFATRAANRGAE